MAWLIRWARPRSVGTGRTVAADAPRSSAWGDGPGAGYGQALAEQVTEQLHQLDLLAAGLRTRSAAEVARIREQTRQTVAMWQRLLAQHTPVDHSGRCPRCRRRGARRRWPCVVWTQAHAWLISAHPPAGAPASTPPEEVAGVTVIARSALPPDSTTVRGEELRW